MDAATQARVFEPFFTTKGEKGTGLGLATVFGVVKQSGGHIEVYSEVGVGTVFKVYLPREREGSSTVNSGISAKLMARGSETILLAEDEDRVRGLAKLVLERAGYRVLEARHGGEAFLICERHAGPIQLLATDVVMPNMSGRQVAERLKALRPEMRVLYLSGYTDDTVVRHGVLGADVAFLQKPFSPTALTQKVWEVLDR
jgi:CheY-like chemotaxis protein